MDRNEEGNSKHLVEGSNPSIGSWAFPLAFARKSGQAIENKARTGRYLEAVLLAALLTMGPFRAMAGSAVLHTAFDGEEVAAQETQAANPPASVAGEEQILSEEEFKEFLQTAKVVEYKHTSKGVTAPVIMTLSDGQRTIEACFQAIDERKAVVKLPSRTELNFRDTYRFNIAAYELAKLLDLGDMVPATVEYKWKGKKGSLSLWVPVKLDEQERLKQKIQPPDVNAWNKQMNKMWVFCELVYDTDRNQTNILITEDWKLWMIDFTRAFRLHKDVNNPHNLVQCDRALLENLRRLDEAEVLEKARPHLTNSEVKALMARRDKIVAHFEKLITQKGEERALY